MSRPGERPLIPQWAPELVVLSYAISWVGAYTSTQIMIHAKYTRSPWVKWLWTLLASLAFGFCAIWSMHFVGMLACRMDIQIAFDISLTILSAVVAVTFTFAALSSAYLAATIENSHLIQALCYIVKTLRGWIFSCCPDLDVEAGYQQLSGEEEESRARVLNDGALQDGTEGADEDGDIYREVIDALEYPTEEGNSAAYGSEPASPPISVPVEPPNVAAALASVVAQRDLMPQRGRLRGPVQMGRSATHPFARSTTLKSPPIVRQRSLPRPTRARISSGGRDTPNTPSTQSSSDSSYHPHARASSRTSSGATLLSATTSLEEDGRSTSSPSWDEMHEGLSREARMRIKARARDRPVPVFGWKYWLNAQQRTITALVVIRAAVWGIALVMMHYCGMWAMNIPGGRISWDMGIVVLSYAVAFAVCLVACTTMEHMEVHFLRQVAFSTIAALGVCSMHYTGMAAATFYTYEPPAPLGQAGYPTYLPVTIVGGCSLCVHRVQSRPCAQRHNRKEPDGGDDIDKATVVAKHG